MRHQGVKLTPKQSNVAVGVQYIFPPVSWVCQLISCRSLRMLQIVANSHVVYLMNLYVT